MYLKMFGLQEKPFHITPNPRFIFLSKNHKEAFAHLLYGVKQRVGFLSLIGEVGTGKTTVLRTLLRQLEQSDYQVALIFNPCLTDLELLQSIHREFNIPCREGEANLSSLHDSLNRFLLEQRQQGKTVVLVIDEAQNLNTKVLEQLRLLSNLETETDKLLQLIIVGQPELDEVLGRHELRQLKQRLIVRYRLTNMDAEDTAIYINHRLKVAGYKGGNLFTAKAISQIYRITNGLPRLINILCDRALLVAYANESEHVDHKIIAIAQAELTGEKSLKPSRWPMITAFGLIVMVLGFFAFQQMGTLIELYNPNQEPAISVVSPPVPEKISIQPIIKSFVKDPRFLNQIKKRIGALTEDESAQLASSAVLERWGQPRLQNYKPGTYKPLETALHTMKMSTIRFQNDPEKLLDFNAPAILTIVLPSFPGKRYLALLEARDGQVRTEPALTADGWFPEEYLADIWLGKAIIPWNNFEQLSHISEPGKQGSDITRIQNLLTQVGYTELTVSGRYDQETIMAVSELQKDTGLSPDGRIGSQTLLHLYRLAGLEMPLLTEEVAP